MEKPHLLAQIYGYAVCLVAVITFIICIANIVPSIIDLGDPLHAGNSWVPAGTPSLASFDNYKMDILKNLKSDDQKAGMSLIPDDKTMHSMFDAAKADKIKQANLSSIRSIVVNGLIIIVSVVLFFLHFTWMRRLTRKVATVS